MNEFFSENLDSRLQNLCCWGASCHNLHTLGVPSGEELVVCCFRYVVYRGATLNNPLLFKKDPFIQIGWR